MVSIFIPKDDSNKEGFNSMEMSSTIPSLGLLAAAEPVCNQMPLTFWEKLRKRPVLKNSDLSRVPTYPCTAVAVAALIKGTPWVIFTGGVQFSQDPA